MMKASRRQQTGWMVCDPAAGCCPGKIQMSAYPGSEAERRVDRGELTLLVATIFERCGMAAEDADLLAETLVQADLRGVHSHGVPRVLLCQSVCSTAASSGSGSAIAT